MSYLHIAAYRFQTVEAENLLLLREKLLNKANELDLKGTILLSEEGINLYAAGEPSAIAAYKMLIDKNTPFKALQYRDTPTAKQPFRRMLVKIKKEIIVFGDEKVQPEKMTAPHLPPQEFKKWYEENRDMVVLDVRNNYEFRLGSFDQAIELDINKFRKFPKKIADLPKNYKEKTIVTFCTGGIRCEKAAEYMRQQGFKKVYQLEGGIINYFKKCGDAHYHGECYVFDDRVAVNGDLKETDTDQCYECGMPLTVAEQKLETCPHCPYKYDNA